MESLPAADLALTRILASPGSVAVAVQSIRDSVLAAIVMGFDLSVCGSEAARTERRAPPPKASPSIWISEVTETLFEVLLLMTAEMVTSSPTTKKRGDWRRTM